MRLVHCKNQVEVKVGDIVELNGCPYRVTYFRPPHKPASSCKVSVESVQNPGMSMEYFVGVIGAEWIEREDRS